MDAILAGERDSRRLEKLRDWRIQASEETIVKSLVGDYREEHLLVLRQSLECYRKYQKMIESLDIEVKRRMAHLPPQFDPLENLWAKSAIHARRQAEPSHWTYAASYTVRSGST